MLSDIWPLLLGTILSLMLYWSIPSEQFARRQLSLVVMSAFLVFIYSPGGFLGCLYLLLVALAAKWVFRVWRGVIPFWLFLGFAVAPLFGFRLFTDQSVFLSFGIAFATVRALGLVITAYGGRQKFNAKDAALLIYFFPLFTVGPVEKLQSLFAEKFSVKFDRQMLTHGIYRICVGLFLVMFVCNDILDPIRSEWFGRDQASISAFTRLEALGFIFANFLYTYLNFEGFSSIAIGLSRLFGLKVAENFDRPLMVSNIAEFWKRYHITMGNWINQFIFFPMVIWLRKSWASYVATIFAFVCFGLWHAFTLNYLVWGLGNGIGVAAMHFGVAQRMFPLIKTRGWLKNIFAVATGFLTLTFISWAQTFANLEDFHSGVVLTTKLLFG